MILEMTTQWLPIIQPGLYGTELGDLYDGINEEHTRDFKRQLCFEVQSVMNEIFSEDWFVNRFGNVTVSNCVLKSPRWYNFVNDWIEFDLDIQRENLLKDYYECFEAWDREDFFRWAKANFGSRSVFISFFPYEPDKFDEAMYTNKGNYNYERAIAMLITYAIEKSKCALDSYQRDLEDTMREYCSQNGLFDYEDDDDCSYDDDDYDDWDDEIYE